MKRYSILIVMILVAMTVIAVGASSLSPDGGIKIVSMDRNVDSPDMLVTATIGYGNYGDNNPSVDLSGSLVFDPPFEGNGLHNLVAPDGADVTINYDDLGQISGLDFDHPNVSQEVGTIFVETDYIDQDEAYKTIEGCVRFNDVYDYALSLDAGSGAVDIQTGFVDSDDLLDVLYVYQNQASELHLSRHGTVILSPSFTKSGVLFDANADGVTDVLNGRELWIQQSAGNFVLERTYGVFNSAAVVAVSQEIIVFTRGQGIYTYPEYSVVGFNTPTDSVDVVEVDNDFYYSQQGSNEVKPLFGGFSTVTPSGDAVRRLSTVDWDGSGNERLMAHTASDSYELMFSGLVTRTIANSFVEDVIRYDLDDDNVLDTISTGGNGTVIERQSQQPYSTSSDLEPVAMFDVDGNGFVDVVGGNVIQRMVNFGIPSLSYYLSLSAVDVPFEPTEWSEMTFTGSNLSAATIYIYDSAGAFWQGTVQESVGLTGLEGSLNIIITSRSEEFEVCESQIGVNGVLYNEIVLGVKGVPISSTPTEVVASLDAVDGESAFDNNTDSRLFRPLEVPLAIGLSGMKFVGGGMGWLAMLLPSLVALTVGVVIRRR